MENNKSITKIIRSYLLGLFILFVVFFIYLYFVDHFEFRYFILQFFSGKFDSWMIRSYIVGLIMPGLLDIFFIKHIIHIKLISTLIISVALLIIFISLGLLSGFNGGEMIYFSAPVLFCFALLVYFKHIKIIKIILTPIISIVSLLLIITLGLSASETDMIGLAAAVLFNLMLPVHLIFIIIYYFLYYKVDYRKIYNLIFFKKSILIFLLIFNIVVISSVFAYSPYYTHPDLTEEIAKFWNLKNDNQSLGISQKEIDWMRKGAIDEDTPARWINHFYDPVHESGWSGKHFGDLSEEEGLWEGESMAPMPAIASIDWVTNQEYQSAYGRQYGNQTWQKAINAYVKGDEKTAFIALGHILHLVEDVSVPAHTRGDTHADIHGDTKDPYEIYAQNYTNFNSLDIAENLKNDNLINFSSIQDAFDYLANYSNNNFFSKDTISNEEYNEPDLKNLIKKTGYLYNDEDTPLTSYEIKKGKIVYSLNDSSLILPSYFTHLAPKAVLTGASVLDLFFREVEMYKENPELLPEIIPDSNEAISSYIQKSPRLLAVNSIGAYDKAVVDTNIYLTKSKDIINNAVSGIKNLFSGTSVAQTSSVLSAVENPVDLQMRNSSVLEAVLAPASDVINEAVNTASASVVSAPIFSSAGNLTSLQSQLDSAQAMINTLQTQANSLSSSPIGAVIAVSATQNIANNQTPATQPTPIPAPGFGGGAPPPVVKTITTEESTKNTQSQTAGYANNSQLDIFFTEDVEQNNNSEADTVPPDAPIIASPSDFSKTFTTSTIVFQGTAESSSIISTDFDNATTTVDSNGTWQLPLAFPQGASIINFFATDTAGNTSSSTETSLLVDSVSPDISLTVLECENSLVSTGCLTKSTESHISWSSSASDLDYFTINSNGTFATTTATSTLVSMPENSLFSFSVSARDKAGNRSATSTRTISTFNSPVVINEVVWAGTADSPSDEWVELYNNTEYDISLDNWILEAEDGAPYIPLSGIIKAKDYYLIERSDDDTISDIKADLPAPFSGVGNSSGLSNGGEVLMLSYKKEGSATTTVDKTVLENNRRVWIGGSTSNYRTMERIDSLVSGEDGSNWGTNNLIIIDGKDAGDFPIKGTPKSRNSISHLIARGQLYITEDIVLTKEKSPYLVDNQWQTFRDGASLTIEPGTVIKFHGSAGFKFQNASIIADGTPDDPIVFTSFYDDEYGGDINNDATSTSPTSGSWYGVMIEGDDSGESVFDNVVFRYAGAPFYKQYSPRANLKIDSAFAHVTNSIFEESYLSGLWLSNSDSVISDNIFRNNNKGHDSSAINSGVVIGEGNPVFKNNTVKHNDRGLYVTGNGIVIDSNIFDSNANEAVYVSGIVPKFTNNSASGNSVNGIIISTHIADRGSTTTLKGDNIPYVANISDIDLFEDSTLVIESGAVIKSKDIAFRINGKLIIEGNESDDIIFTSLYDDTIFPGTIVGGTTTPKLSPQWKGIHILKGGLMNAKGFTVRYAGDNFYGNSESGVSIEEGSAHISEALFTNNYPFGLLSKQSENLVIENSVFRDNNYSGKWGTQGALAIYNSSTTLNSLLFENNAIGILVDTASNLTASLIEFISNTANTSPESLF
ncbi:MAG: lamin tail domain-containing protein [Parcubacteria group bacterium]|nr:lamin tail domain-containing protein [Parcubacteria group bacterium]MCR4342499.1 lamin tail domain-containing protein [Patescibacteria group bacterium]